MLSRTTVHAFALLLVAASQAIAEWEKTYEFEGNTRRMLLCEGAKASLWFETSLDHGLSRLRRQRGDYT